MNFYHSVFWDQLRISNSHLNSDHLIEALEDLMPVNINNNTKRRSNPSNNWPSAPHKGNAYDIDPYFFERIINRSVTMLVFERDSDSFLFQVDGFESYQIRYLFVGGGGI